MVRYGYVIEVLKLLKNDEGEDPIQIDGSMKHLGYMKQYFRTIDEACIYFNTHNAGCLNPLSKYNYMTEINDLVYIIREDYGMVTTINGFHDGN